MGPLTNTAHVTLALKFVGFPSTMGFLPEQIHSLHWCHILPTQEGFSSPTEAPAGWAKGGLRAGGLGRAAPPLLPASGRSAQCLSHVSTEYNLVLIITPF